MAANTSLNWAWGTIAYFAALVRAQLGPDLGDMRQVCAGHPWAIGCIALAALRVVSLFWSLLLLGFGVGVLVHEISRLCGFEDQGEKIQELERTVARLLGELEAAQGDAAKVVLENLQLQAERAHLERRLSAELAIKEDLKREHEENAEKLKRLRAELKDFGSRFPPSGVLAIGVS